MAYDDVITAVRALFQRLLGRPFTDADDDTDVFDNGWMEPSHAETLIVELERTFGITVEAHEMDANHFRSVRSAAEFVLQKQEG